VNKTLTKKFIYVIAAVAMLAMMLPAMSVPVSAQPPVTFTPPVSHDVVGDAATFTLTGANATSFSVADSVGGTGATIVNQHIGTDPVSDPSWVTIQSFNRNGGEATVTANVSGTLYTADKKWGLISRTTITPPQDVVMTSSGSTSAGSATITDQVFATYSAANNQEFPNVNQPLGGEGAVLNWYLLKDNTTTAAWVASHSNATEPDYLLNGAPTDSPPNSNGLTDHPEWLSTFATFNAPNSGKTAITTSDLNGVSTVSVNATGEEAVLVVVVPSYPTGASPEIPVMLEWTKVNFWTSENEIVQDVRWKGEKIVLEKHFNPAWAGYAVRFAKEAQGPGALESVDNQNYSADFVLSTVDPNGWVRCILISNDPGEVDVDLTIYLGTTPEATTLFNQHAFTVYYLALEDVTLHDVVGKRAGHDSGLWTPENPWDTSKDWEPNHVNSNDPNLQKSSFPEVLNVSQDALLRAQVRGWFLSNNQSSQSARPERTIDTDPTVETGDYDGTKDADHTNDQDMVLPAHRWILPDDWARLAGADSVENRIHWDIMDNPFDTVGTQGSAFNLTAAQDLANAEGPYVNPYKTGPVVAVNPVIGPFRPGLEEAIAQHVTPPYAYNPNIPVYAIPQEKTVVPNGVIEKWDAPMPPAKVTFRIQDVSVTNAEITNLNGGISDYQIPLIENDVVNVGDTGFFKDAWKTDIYYVTVNGTNGNPAVKVYTNPFYAAEIAAYSQIPVLKNTIDDNGGYDWNSWDSNYGPYPFWKIINRLPNEQLTTTIKTPTTITPAIPRDNSNFPSKVQVYSDNHGEAMVYLNGNYNLDPGLFGFKGHDVPFGSTVGSTTVVAIADYPYFRERTALVSMPVTKMWTWGGLILGTTDSADRMVLTVGDNYDVDTTTPTNGFSNDKLVFVWATDRDGLRNGVYGAGVPNTSVNWTISPVAAGGTVARIDPSLTDTNGVSQYNATMKNIHVVNGFLSNTQGVLTGSHDGTQATSWMRPPTQAEKDLFNKFWGTGDPTTNPVTPATHPLTGADGNPLNPNNFVVAAIDLLDASRTADISVTAVVMSPDMSAIPSQSGTAVYVTNVNFASSYPLDDNIIAGDANGDGHVNVVDITAIENMILGKQSSTVQADAAMDDVLSMGDVVTTERIILGLPTTQP
jgi:hypothetical protein